MTPFQIARLNLTDYAAQVVSRIILPMQATETLPSGTRQFRAVIWNLTDDNEADHGAWTMSRATAFAEAEDLMLGLEERLEAEAEALEQAELAETAS